MIDLYFHHHTFAFNVYAFRCCHCGCLLLKEELETHIEFHINIEKLTDIRVFFYEPDYEKQTEIMKGVYQYPLKPILQQFLKKKREKEV